MVTLKEMLGNNSIVDIPMEHIRNMEILLKKVNLLREAWAKPLIVTSGYRSAQDMIRIYSKLGKKPPAHSNHLTGNAIDLYDPDLSFTKWLKEEDSRRLQALGLYAEEGCKNWCHLQNVAPRSGSRWFLP